MFQSIETVRSFHDHAEITRQLGEVWRECASEIAGECDGERETEALPPEPRERSPSKCPYVPTAALDAVCELKECKASSSSGGAVVNIAGAS